MTPHLPIYMDYGATNPVDPRVAQAMIPWLTEHFGNPASRSHAWGWEAEAAVEKAREDVAALIGADPREIVWTSGATESNNLAIKGAAQFYKARGKHIITVKTEHKAVLDTVRELERQGFDATYLDVQENGLLDLNALRAAIRPDTILISVMFVNNEIGVIQDIPAIGAMCREKGIIFHVDAAQATGKVAINMADLPIDLMSLASHKTSASLEPSYVLRALGRSDELAHSSLRITIGRFTTEQEIDEAVALLRDRVGKLRELSPLWEMYKDGVDLSTIQWAAH